jgi:hypothetical protein
MRNENFTETKSLQYDTKGLLIVIIKQAYNFRQIETSANIYSTQSCDIWQPYC